MTNQELAASIGASDADFEFISNLVANLMRKDKVKPEQVNEEIVAAYTEEAIRVVQRMQTNYLTRGHGKRDFSLSVYNLLKESK